MGGEENLLVNNIPAEVIATGYVNGFDLAVLGVEKLNVPLFQLISLSEAENQKFRIAGHYLYGENKNVMLETVAGTLGKKRFARQNNETVTAWKLLINEGDRLRQGYSGAPVVDLSDRVLGVATYMDKDGTEGLAISIEALNKIWPQMPVTISQQLKLKSEPLPEVELKSDVGCDYTKLKKLLSEGKWKEADRETALCMLQVARREGEGWLREEDIDKFPCTDLRTIDQLWVKYSDGKFGFSVQKKIYQILVGMRQYNEGFCNKVGWSQGGKWLYYSDLTFSLDTHYMGHLPFLGFGWEKEDPQAPEDMLSNEDASLLKKLNNENNKQTEQMGLSEQIRAMEVTAKIQSEQIRRLGVRANMGNGISSLAQRLVDCNI